MVVKGFNILDKKSSESDFIANKKPNSMKTCNAISFSNKFEKLKPNNETISPYLNGAKIQMLSQMNERKYVQKKTTDVSLSFSQANKIYQVNSDEFRCSKGKNKKNKSSLSTPSNELSNIQHTVSDMNDSEYRIRVDNNRRSKRRRRQSNKYSRPYFDSNNYEFYNGDLLLCPGLKMDKNHLNDDKKNNCKKLRVKRKRKSRDNVRPSDVWTMLRNMNRFHHISSPPISEDSNETIKKKGNFIKYSNKAGLIETTEEFSIISSYDIKNKSQSDFSQPTSIDRITIIDKNDKIKLQELVKGSISNSLGSQLKKKRLIKNKFQIGNKELQNLTSITNGIETCKIKDSTKDFLNDNNSDVFKKSVSKENLNEFSNCHNNEEFVLGCNDLLKNNLRNTDKNWFYKKQLSLYGRNTCQDIIKVPNSENQLIGDSDISSKSGLNGLSAIKLTKKTKIMAEKALEDIVNKKNRDFLKPNDIQKRNQNIFLDKLTVTEIRRQLARLKFPIVILTKDEISSTFQIVDYDPPQFNGLNQTIWPFMVEWSLNLKNIKSFKNSIQNFESMKYINKREIKLPITKTDVMKISDSTSPRMKQFSKTNLNSNTDVNKKIKSTEPKVLGQFKNKVMDLICNKSQKNLIDSKNTKTSKNQTFINTSNKLKYNKSNANIVHGEIPEINISKRNLDNFIVVQNPQPGYKYPWSKAKWASDFIDNIIKKIRKGVYYTQDSEVDKKITNDISIPMETVTEAENITNQLITKDTDYACIPGFDESQDIKTLKLEVKMVTRTQISIHHCSTNVVLNFDITVPSDVDSALPSSFSSCLPVTTNGHMSTLYKCKTTIPNAVLPGELCSILPKLLNEIMNGNKTNLLIPHSTSTPITETNKQTGYITDMNSSVQSPMTKKLMNGIFCTTKLLQLTGNSIRSRMLFCTDLYKIQNNYLSVKPLLGLMNILYKCVNVKNNSLIGPDVSRYCTKFISEKPLKQCMTLVPYTSPKQKPKLELQIQLFSSNVDLTANNLQTHIFGLSNLSTGLSQWRTNSILTDSYCHTNIINNWEIDRSRPIILSISNVPHNSTECMQRNDQIESYSFKKGKLTKTIVRNGIKKSFSKTYKKYIANVIKSNCTALNKITNLDDFFYALGCFKTLSNVLKGYTEETILSSIFNMKNWTKKITQAQALLVLLLSNKKETVNLKRFRSMLLQGIAVNRITTVEELDMELEVIEKENLCISQNEGISFLSGPNNNLLDELCWIAKTTASDYQKPFDESSKKLLKSLIEKRKKLNPSYLRVMARYVGLGLLKQRGIL